MIWRRPLDQIDAALVRRRARHLASVDELSQKWADALAEIKDLRAFLYARGLMPDYITWWSVRHRVPMPSPEPTGPVEVVPAVVDPTSALDLRDIANAVEVLELGHWPRDPAPTPPTHPTARHDEMPQEER